MSDIQTLVDGIYNDFKNTVLTAVTNDAPKVIAVAMGYVADEEKTLKDLALNVLNGDLKADFLLRRLKELETNAYDSLLSIEQIIASDLQALITNLFSSFVALLQAAVLAINV